MFALHGGTTLQNLIDCVADGRLEAQLVLVVSSRAEAFGLERARRAGIPTGVVDRGEAGSREEFSRMAMEVHVFFCGKLPSKAALETAMASMTASTTARQVGTSLKLAQTRQARMPVLLLQRR